MTFSSDTAAEAHLADLFDLELGCLGELRDILAQERAALLAGDIPALEEITCRKGEILERQSGAAQQRRERLSVSRHCRSWRSNAMRPIVTMVA